MVLWLTRRRCSRKWYSTVATPNESGCSTQSRWRRPVKAVADVGLRAPPVASLRAAAAGGRRRRAPDDLHQRTPASTAHCMPGRGGPCLSFAQPHQEHALIPEPATAYLIRRRRPRRAHPPTLSSRCRRSPHLPSHRPSPARRLDRTRGMTPTDTLTGSGLLTVTPRPRHLLRQHI